jgi:hypothetical protein
MVFSGNSKSNYLTRIYTDDTDFKLRCPKTGVPVAMKNAQAVWPAHGDSKVAYFFAGVV